MICRAEPGGLLLFEASTDRTACLSDRELEIFKCWVETEQRHAFVDRLFDDGVLTPLDDAQRADILEQINRIPAAEAPSRSFAAPESIHIDLTTKCNLYCPQCYKNRGENCELPREVLFDILRQARKMRVFQIAFGGGEPLLYPYLLEAVRLISAAQMACSITTNGAILYEETLKELREAGLHHMQVSLNGSSAEIHAKSREAFDEAVRALRFLHASGLSFGINWVARKDNVHDFGNVVRLAKELGTENLNILRYKPSCTEEYRAVALSANETAGLAAKIRQVRGLHIKIDSAYSSLLCLIYGDKINSAFSGCGAGRRFFAVGADGSLKGCSHTRHSEFNNSLRDFWQHSALLDRFRQAEERVGGQCGDCRYTGACRGCRAICEHTHEDFYAGEEDCPAFLRREPHVSALERL